MCLRCPQVLGLKRHLRVFKFGVIGTNAELVNAGGVLRFVLALTASFSRKYAQGMLFCHVLAWHLAFRATKSVES